MGVYAENSGPLTARGYGTVPIIFGTKAPGFWCAGIWVPLLGWQKRYLERTPSAEDFAAWGKGDTGIGVVGGHASHGMVGVDIDTDDPKIKAAIIEVLPETPVKKIGQKGETRFYYGPDITASRSWNIARRRVCDIIADGRQTVLPPTIHEKTGRPYRWVGPPLAAFDPQDLPFLSADAISKIDAVLALLGWKPEPTHAGHAFDMDDMDGELTPHRQLNEFALEHLDRWIPKLGLYKCRRRPDGGGYAAVAHWRESSTGRELKLRNRNLSIHPSGIKDFGDGRNGGDGFTYTPLDLVMAANDCDLDTAFKFLSDHTGWAGKRIVLVDAAEVLGPAPCPGTAAGAPAIEAPEPPPAEARAEEPTPIEGLPIAAEVKTEDPIDELDPYTRDVPGVVGEVIEWILATARRPNRVLALAAAISLVGTLIGRRVAGPTGSATHLYVVVTTPTAAGKQHQIDCINDLMTSAGAKEHVGGSSFMSGSAICNSVLRCPLQLCCMDELGQFLSKISARDASGHERAMSGVLRSLWGISFGLYATPEWADRPPQHIHSPALSIFGTSTRDELLQTLQGEAVENGFLSRFLVLQSRSQVHDHEPLKSRRQVPESLAANCRQLYRWQGDDIELIDIKRPVEQRVTDLPWASPRAEQEFTDFTRMIDDYVEQQSHLHPYLVRVAETALRLATIRAAGRSFQAAKVNIDDMRWGKGIAWQASYKLAMAARGLAQETEYSRWCKKLTDYVRDCETSGQPATVRSFMRNRGRGLKAKDVKEMVKHLIEIGLLTLDSSGHLHSGDPETE